MLKLVLVANLSTLNKLSLFKNYNYKILYTVFSGGGRRGKRKKEDEGGRKKEEGRRFSDQVTSLNELQC